MVRKHSSPGLSGRRSLKGSLGTPADPPVLNPHKGLLGK